MAGHSSPSISRSTSSQKRRAETPPPAPKAVPSATPISNKISGNSTYSSGLSTGQDENRQLADETRGLFLGAMPPSKFLDDFLPLSQDVQERPDSKKAFARVVKKKKGKENVMYGPFVSMVSFFVVCLVNIW